jgi:branched-chain amino acid transport system ATP-binding protein
MTQALLQVENVSVSFRGTKALQDVSFSCKTGEITGLIGPNGAGKTTMFNVISGLLKPSSGRVVFDGVDLTKAKPARRAKQGISRTFQRLELFTSLSVRDNLRVAGEIHNATRRSGRLDIAAETERVMGLLELADVADREVTELPTGRARVVEVARALMTKPKLVLLDEPASGQSEEETERFAELLKHLVATDGLSVCLVEHDVPLVMGLCDTIHVLNFGALLASGTPAEIRSNNDVADAYLGAPEETI